MITRILTLGRWTLVEALRERLLYVVALFATVLVTGSCVLTPLAPGAQKKLVADLGLASLNILGILVILLSGTGLVRREIERRSLDVLLTKPVSRLEYLVGKWLGLVATLAVLVGAMTVVLALTLEIAGFGWHGAYLQAVAATGCEVLVVASIAVLFSTFTSPTLASLFTLALVAGGHLSQNVLALASGSALEPVLQAVRWVVPALGLFDLRGEVVYGDVIPLGHLVTAAAYAGAYALTALYLASLVFRRRDLR